MRDFPDEIKLHVFSFLRDKQSLGRVAQVSKEWNVLAKKDELWSPFFNTKNTIKNAKEKFKKNLVFPKIFYYECSSFRSYSKHYHAPFDFLNKYQREIPVYTPSAIGVGTYIGPHANILKALQTANCIVINVNGDDCQHFEKHLSKLLNISQIPIPDHPMFKSPVRLECFPPIPIIVITEFVELVKQKARSNHLPINAIIKGNLSPNKSLNAELSVSKIKISWDSLEKVVKQLLLNEDNQIEIETEPKKCCLIM